MSGAREIITIQAGNYANFIGTHWWNIQESSFCYDPNTSLPLDINHDILFREGVNYKGEVTFTPRLVLIDLKSNMKSIRKECPLYHFPKEESNPLWDGPVDVVQESPIKKNPFLEVQTSELAKGDDNADSERDAVQASNLYNFDTPTTSWCDFLKTNLHPRSFCLLNEMASEDKNPLEIYSSGHEVYKKNGKDMIEDSIRRMAEECDYLQGFQLIFDSCNGFSGITSLVMQHLDDEYSRRASICFPTFQSSKPPPYKDIKDQMHRLYAILLSLSSMTSYSSLFSPLALSSDVIKFSEPHRKFPFLQYNPSVPYQTSSISAAAIETLTSQYRLKSSKFSLSDVTSAMSMYSRKLVCSSICLPFPLSDDAFLSTMIQKDVPEYFMTSLTPFYNPECERTLYQSAVLRGIPQSKFMKPNKSYYAIEHEQIFGEYLNKYSPSSVTTATVFAEKCNVISPFPKLFKNTVGINGFLNSECHPNDDGVEKVPVAASFSSSDSAAQYIDSLVAEANKICFKEYVKCAESSYEKDEFVEVMQNIIALRDNYEDY